MIMYIDLVIFNGDHNSTNSQLEIDKFLPNLDVSIVRAFHGPLSMLLGALFVAINNIESNLTFANVLVIGSLVLSLVINLG